MSLLNKASLIQIPSGYKDGTLYSAKPTNGDGDFTFSRGSNLAATRVNSEGLIEKGRENLLLQSNSFDTSWVNTNVSVTSGQSGYDGSSDAWQVDISASFAQVEQSISSSGVQTFSVYAKAGSLNWVRLRVDHSTFSGTYFDLQNGLVGTTASDIDSTIEDVGSGWYRCTLTYNNNITKVRIYPAQADNDLTATSGNIYIQDAQLEQGLVATDYIETTTTTAQAGILEDMPRLDYSGGASCPSLLLEPSRTNKLPQSEYFEDSGFTSGDITLDFGYLAPDGTNSAYKITATTKSSAYLVYTTLFDANDARSIYAKTVSGTGTTQLLSHNLNTNNTFTLTEEWQRFEVTSTPSTSQNFYPVDFRGSTTLTEVIIWGGQAEAGSYPTSYIPTYGSGGSVTRSDEHKILTGNLLSKGIFDSTWTFLYDNTFVDVNRDSACALFLFQDAGGSNNVRISLNGDGSYRLQDSENGVAANVDGNKVLCRFNGSTIDWYVDGSEVASDSVTPSNFQSISVDNRSNYTAKPIKINKEIVFPTALTDAECIELTTI